jgi:hypothetical protein
MWAGTATASTYDYGRFVRAWRQLRTNPNTGGHDVLLLTSLVVSVH